MKASAWATIDLGALRHNFSRVKSLSGPAKILAMIKSDGYGHGMVRIAKALSDVDAFGVAAIEEALILRNAQISTPIVVMSRFDHQDQLPVCSERDIALVIHDLYQVELLERSNMKKPISIWLKLETGMGRLGLFPRDFPQAWQRLQKLSYIEKPIGLMTHFACADILEHPLTATQLNIFHSITQEMPGPRSIANSAGILAHPASIADWVRPGIMLYGVSPFANTVGEQFDLRPVMTFNSQLIAVKQATAGDSIGYTARWTCPEDMSVGIIAAGYGDGYPWHAVDGTPILINGIICPLIGRVSMDMVAVDLRQQPNARVGDSVILWGKGLPVEKVAQFAGFSYELLCHLTKRVEFITYE